MAKILIAVLAFGICPLLSEGATCEIRGKGRLTTFSNARVIVKIPCKYQAARFNCKDYDVKAVPGQVFDSKGRYFINTMWVSIAKEGTPYYWRGRISTKRVDLYFNDTGREIYSTKQQNMDGASFSIKTVADVSSNSVALGVSDIPLADFRIVYYGYNERSKVLRQNAGVQIICNFPSYSKESLFPESLCGNETDPKAVRDWRQALGYTNKPKSIIYDVLDDTDVTQINPQCETATEMFKSCEGNRTHIVELCSVVIKDFATMTCLNRYQNDPMDIFIYCLGYKCQGDTSKCDILEEAMEKCPNDEQFHNLCK